MKPHTAERGNAFQGEGIAAGGTAGVDDCAEAPVRGGVLVEARDVSKYFPLGNPSILRLLCTAPERLAHFCALDGISCTVRAGEFLGVLGRNGAGKSTFLRVLGDLLPPEKGIVFTHGDILGIYELGSGANPSLTGRTYTEWWLRFLGKNKQQCEVLVEEVFEFSELGVYFDQPVRSYSAGMTARLYFSAVTCIEAPILLIDEALSVGDEHFQRKCWKRLREKIRNGASGVLVSHDWVSVLRLCHRTLVLDHGRPLALDESQKAIRVYLGEEELGGRFLVSGARFDSTLPREFHAEPRKPFVLDIPVTVEESGDVVFSYSIEFMKPGWGWNIMLLESGIPVASAPGKYRIEVDFGPLPLAEGSYELSLFLSRKEPEGNRVLLDARGWLYEEPVSLRVGEPGPGEGVVQSKVEFHFDE